MYTPTLTSNWVSHIFWFGLAKGKIQKNAELSRKHSGLKEAKTVAFQLRIPIAIGTAAEAKANFSIHILGRK